MSIKSRRINLLKFIDKFSEIIWFKKKILILFQKFKKLQMLLLSAHIIIIYKQNNKKNKINFQINYIINKVNNLMKLIYNKKCL